MPYKRNYRKGRKPYKKTYRKNNFASRVKAIVRKSVVEKHQSKAVATTSGITTTPTIQHITAISSDHETDFLQQRQGFKISIGSVYTKGLLTLPSNNVAGSWFRISLIQDTQQHQDATPAYTDIYESISPSSGLAIDNRGRFKVLWTRTMVFNQDVDTNQTKRLFKVWKKFKRPINVRYNGGAATDIQQNGLYLITISDNVSDGPIPNLETYVNFTDA